METIQLTITAASLNIIRQALGELPLKMSYTAFQEIDQQVQAHLRRAQNVDSGSGAGASDGDHGRTVEASSGAEG